MQSSRACRVYSPLPLRLRLHNAGYCPTCAGWRQLPAGLRCAVASVGSGQVASAYGRNSRSPVETCNECKKFTERGLGNEEYQPHRTGLRTGPAILFTGFAGRPSEVARPCGAIFPWIYRNLCPLRRTGKPICRIQPAAK